MEIIKAIKERRSVRNYNGQPLDHEALDYLQRAINDSYSLFGGSATIRLKSFDLEGDFKPSTYGVIRGASDFFLVGMGEDDDSALTAGFQFEQIVLKAWDKGLGTCWIAATFKGSQFDKNESWPDGESLRIISPVGIPKEKNFFEKFTRKMLGSDNRKPITELFFETNFTKPISPKNKFFDALAMLRLAPSSTNSQPWRALVEDNKVLFYYIPKSKISIIDCGIGICHFYETEKLGGAQGEFVKESSVPEAPKNWKYLISYRRV
ncbi:MAG: hypothetical protein J1E38_08385 [Paramuribaculum sp.]|nr:hypothetical protein [Paramuribaculum sp.]